MQEYELNLHYIYYEMTWAEHKLRSVVSVRKELDKAREERFRSWVIKTAPHQDPKALMRMTPETWMPLPGDKKHVSRVKESTKEKYRKLQIEYQKKKDASQRQT